MLGPTPESRRTDLRLLVDQFTRSYAQLWQETPSSLPRPSVAYSPLEQNENGRSCDQFLLDIEAALTRFPSDPRAREMWRRRITVLFRRLCCGCLGYSEAMLNTLFQVECFDATRDFIGRARRFNAGMDSDDLGQALRNVWVMNSIQQWLGTNVSCSPSVFAYSMLYPYTDNYLDDASHSRDHKRAFSSWLERRLQGDAPAPRTAHESAVSDLVACIESEHCRTEAAEVFDSLLGIHSAQTNSLQQQSRQDLTHDDLLELSIRKGGTSVLAHGYLVNRQVTPKEAEFIFGYGVFLQLFDDLQDVTRDQRRKHTTLFTRQSVHHEPLDQLTSRLYHFMQNVLRSVSRQSPEVDARMRELIEKNCVLLMMQSIARHRHLFSGDYLMSLERHSPLTFSYLRQSSTLLRRRFRKMEHSFAKHHGCSVYTVLGNPS